MRTNCQFPDLLPFINGINVYNTMCRVFFKVMIDDVNWHIFYQSIYINFVLSCKHVTSCILAFFKSIGISKVTHVICENE
jgi:hypothetical protein